MKLKADFVTHVTGEQQIMVSVSNNGFHGLVRSNKTAANIIDLLKKETTKEQIVQEMCKKYDAPEAVIAGDVDKVLENLRSIGALDE